MFNPLANGEALSANLAKANGVILYEGPSKLDGQPIVVIATGIRNKSKNAKTGDMIQTWILRSDMHPQEALVTGQDAAICGSCIHRGDGTGKGRSCYVLMFAPGSIWKAYEKGVYPKASAFEAAALFAGRMVRLGAYGDPAAAPYAMWKVALTNAKGWTGYTHQWRNEAVMGRHDWAALIMASADSVADMEAAHAKGFRTFRVTSEALANLKGEAVCPASEEKGKTTDCATCKACMGTSSKAKASITIAAHGGGSKHFS